MKNKNNIKSTNIFSDSLEDEIKLSIRKSKQIIEEANKKMALNKPLTLEERVLSRPRATFHNIAKIADN